MSFTSFFRIFGKKVVRKAPVRVTGEKLWYRGHNLRYIQKSWTRGENLRSLKK